LAYRRSSRSGDTLRGGDRPHSGRLFSLLLLVALALTLGFIAVPLVAIFLHVSPGELVSQLGSDAAVDALVVTVKTSIVAQLLILGIGTPAAYFLATRSFRGRNALVTLIELPIVLPPAVAGIALLVTFGRLGLLGDSLDALGVSIGFTQAAVVIAVVFVAGPFYVRGAIAAFEAVDTTLLSASRTLGAGPARTFRRIALPLARSGLAAAGAISFARGIGEFGATLFFAGSLQGVTQTVSLAIYAQLDLDFNVALALSALLVVVSAAILFGIKLLPWTRSLSTSPSRSARSVST
jgi:molybdate transport system permease protein